MHRAKVTATLPARNEQKNEQKAAKPEPASQRTPFKPGTMLSLRTPLDAQISPDGRSVAFLVNEYVPERPQSPPRLWLAPVDGGERILSPLLQATTAARIAARAGRPMASISPSFPRASSDAGDTQQIYVTTLADGEPGEARKVCAMPNGAESLAWSPDGTRIAFLSLEGAEPGQRSHCPWLAASRPPPPPLDGAPGERHARAGHAARRDDLGVRLVATERPPRRLLQRRPRRDAIGISASSASSLLDGGAVRQLGHLTRQAGALTWSPDGTRIGYVSGEWSDRGIVGGDVVCHLGGGRQAEEPDARHPHQPKLAALAARWQDAALRRLGGRHDIRSACSTRRAAR